MNDLPRQKLRELIEFHGDSLCHDKRRTEALLRDYCGEHKLEIRSLLVAQAEGVPHELLVGGAAALHGLVIPRLERKLREEAGLTAEAAAWAVESWAGALGVLPQLVSVQAEPVSAKWIVYLLVETSAAMAALNPDEFRFVLNDVLHQLADVFGRDGAMRVGAITFGGDAQMVHPGLVSADELVIPEFEFGGDASLGKAFDAVSHSLEEEVTFVEQPPVIFLVTAGRPTDEWRASRDRVLRKRPPKQKMLPRLVVFGCGPQIDEATISAIADAPYWDKVGLAVSARDLVTNGLSRYIPHEDVLSSDAWSPLPRPGGSLARHPLHVIWILDCSDSMAGDKIHQLNFAIREAIPELQRAADENPNVDVLVRVIAFSSGARWSIEQPTLLDEFKWLEFTAGGNRDIGSALVLAAEAMKKLPARGFPPVLILISDGASTDDFDQGLERLMAEPWGKKAVRIGVAIGQHADRDALQRFIGIEGIQPLIANNPAALVRHIKWESTQVVRVSDRQDLW